MAPLDDPARLSDARKEELRAVLTRSAAALARAQALSVRHRALRESTTAAMQDNRGARDEAQRARDGLREAVCRYVAVLREDGAPPERVVTLVKSATSPELSAPAVGGDAQASRVLLAEVVSWCIDAYYVA
ncbi:MAG TPA: hypothetical protein VKA84_25390 [Gemmatimonadaceae bacterium]|nr:hypothetical protein [Gemmatimonadaceae bacterium]